MKKVKQTKYVTDNGKFRFFVDAEKKSLWPLFIVIAVVVLLGIFVVSGLRTGDKLRLTKVTVAHEQVPKSFDGFRILQITDLHGREMGDRQSEIKELLEKEWYDIVLLTGDYLKNTESEDFWIVRDLLDSLRDGVPVYYVLGECEYTPKYVSETSDKWKMCIIPPEKTSFQLFIEEEYDAKFVYPIQKITNEAEDSIYLTGIAYDKETMNAIDFDPDVDFSITVTHKPINYDVSRRLRDVNKRMITEIDYDLSISGHTCGGQYRLPLLKAVFDEEEGWFPQEDDLIGLSRDSAGRYNYICGGIGVAKGFRFFSRPEISIIELEHVEVEED